MAQCVDKGCFGGPFAFSGGMSEQLDRQHEAVWSAIDEIAAQCQMSASRLAIVSGFDATTFNKSKRTLGDKRRWPSMEVIASVLQVAGLTYAEFGALIDKNRGSAVVPTAQQ